MRKLIDGYALIKWIKETQHMTTKMKNVICKIETMPDAESTGALDDAICEYVAKGFMSNPYDRPKGVYDSIALVNKETEREDLSDEIREYLFCDLRKKLWGLDSRPQGEWIEQEDDYHHYWECSECGMGVGLDDIRNYCPLCGARMLAKDTNVPNKKGADDE